MPKRIINHQVTCYYTKHSTGDRAPCVTSALLVEWVPGARFSECETRLYVQKKFMSKRSFVVRSWLPSWVYPVEVLHHLLGSRAEQHVLASNSKQQQSGGPNLLGATPQLKTGVQVAQSDRGAGAHHRKCVPLHFQPSSQIYGRFSIKEWPFLGCFRLFSARSS